MTDFIYDIETYPNLFTICLIDTGFNNVWQYEISQWQNDELLIRSLLKDMASRGSYMIGFNNNTFDYTVIDYLIRYPGCTADDLYTVAMEVINNPEPWPIIREYEQIIQQIDLYKIHHFDNNARRTSLKVLEFNMRMDNIEELPIPPGTYVDEDQREIIHRYNYHDTKATGLFWQQSLDQIKFRAELEKKYRIPCRNYNDTKIGKEYFIKKLEERNPGSCYLPGTRKPRQTPRPQINLAECVFPWIRFANSEFTRIVDYFKSQVIKETKGVFKNLNCTVNNFQFDFGLGGIHGSVEFREIHSGPDHEIIDLDVTSYYPSIAIKHRIYPEHLGSEFCNIYQDVMDERKKYPKGSPENAVMKLALNGVYGDSNNKYSPFYDPKYTMTVTINGQLMLCLLAEWLMKIPGVELIQVNTDGLTIKVLKDDNDLVHAAKTMWEVVTGLQLEEARYKSMFIRDVNNYIAVYEHGDVKRKGAYEYERDWSQNFSSLVVPKAVEAHLVYGTPIKDFILNHMDLFDFMIRAKLPRNMRLELHKDGEVVPLSNIQRYYVTHTGGYLKKIMPPLKGKTEERIRDIESGWKVTPCNNIDDAQALINYDYYIEEAEKLTLGMH